MNDSTNPVQRERDAYDQEEIISENIWTATGPFCNRSKQLSDSNLQLIAGISIPTYLEYVLKRPRLV
jgi:hypothetical protein